MREDTGTLTRIEFHFYEPCIRRHDRPVILGEPGVDESVFT